MTLQKLNGEINPAWFKERQGKLGASDIHKIIKKGKGGEESQTMLTFAKKLAAERLVGHSVDQVNPNNPDILRGNMLEDIAIATYEIRYGVLTRPAAWVEHPSIENSGATPDAFVGADGLVQVKAPRFDKMLRLVMADEIPKEYEPQMAWECAVTNREWNDLALYSDELPIGKKLWVKRYEPTKNRLVELENKAIAFLELVDEIFDKISTIEW